MLASYARWYTFLPPQWSTIPPPLTIYLTLIASNENEMMQKALQTLNRDDVKLNTLAPFMKEYHQQEEDYLQRATAYAKQEIRYPFQVTAVAMTDEDSYTCEHCKMTFETKGHVTAIYTSTNQFRTPSFELNLTTGEVRDSLNRNWRPQPLTRP